MGWLCRCVDLLVCLVVLILCEMFLFVLRYSICLGCFVMIFLCCVFVLCLFIGVLYDLCSVLSGCKVCVLLFFILLLFLSFSSFFLARPVGRAWLCLVVWSFRYCVLFLWCISSLLFLVCGVVVISGLRCIMVFVGISRCVFFIVVICGLFSLLSSLHGFFLISLYLCEWRGFLVF